jgi:hypothetical protein
MDNNIVIDDLKEGDILLYHGTDTWMAWFIQFVDGTPYNHASIYMGNGYTGEVLNNSEGLIKDKLNATGCQYLMAVRFNPPAPIPTIAPVLSVADNYIQDGSSYTTAQAVLAGILCLTKRIPLSPSAVLMVNGILNLASSIINEITSNGKKSMICSEFTYRCYEEAGPQYGILLSAADDESILGWIKQNSNTSILTQLEDEIIAIPQIQDIEDMIQKYVNEIKDETQTVADTLKIQPQLLGVEHSMLIRSSSRFLNAYQKLVPELPIQNTNNQINPHFVTPGDLFRATNLISAGKLPTQ